MSWRGVADRLTSMGYSVQLKTDDRGYAIWASTWRENWGFYCAVRTYSDLPDDLEGAATAHFDKTIIRLCTEHFSDDPFHTWFRGHGYKSMTLVKAQPPGGADVRAPDDSGRSDSPDTVSPGQ